MIRWVRSKPNLISHHLIAKSNSSLRANELEANLILLFDFASSHCKILYKSPFQCVRSNFSSISHHLSAKSSTSLRANLLRAILFFLSSLASSHCKTHYKSSTQWGRSNPSLISHHLSAKSSTRAILFFFWILHHLIAKFTTSLRSSDPVIRWVRSKPILILHLLIAKFSASLRANGLGANPNSELAFSQCKIQAQVFDLGSEQIIFLIRIFSLRFIFSIQSPYYSHFCQL